MATLQEDQGIETRHVGSSKGAFCARVSSHFHTLLLQNRRLLLVFSWTPKSTTSKSMFRAGCPSSFITCRKMPHLPRNLHNVTTWLNLDNAIRKKHATRHVWSAAPATLNNDGGPQTVDVLETTQIFLCLPRKTTFDTLWHMLECHKMPRLPRETRLRDVWNLQKRRPLQNFRVFNLNFPPARWQTLQAKMHCSTNQFASLTTCLCCWDSHGKPLGQTTFLNSRGPHQSWNWNLAWKRRCKGEEQANTNFRLRRLPEFRPIWLLSFSGE